MNERAKALLEGCDAKVADCDMRVGMINSEVEHLRNQANQIAIERKVHEAQKETILTVMSMYEEELEQEPPLTRPRPPVDKPKRQRAPRRNLREATMSVLSSSPGGSAMPDAIASTLGIKTREVMPPLRSLLSAGLIREKDGVITLVMGGQGAELSL